MKQAITWLDILFKTGIALTNNFSAWVTKLIAYGTTPTITMWAIILLIVGYFDIFKMRKSTTKKITKAS